MDETETDKSEAATPFKMSKARERGAVARSLDLGFLAALTATISFLWAGGERLANDLAQGTRTSLAAAPSILGNPAALGELAARAAAPATSTLTVFAAALFGIALVLDFFQVGPIFSAHPLKPDFSRINPAKGLKRIFSWRALIEAFKASVKLSVYATIAWLVIRGTLSREAAAASDAGRLAGIMLAALQRLLLYFAMAALGFAILDQIFVRRDFAKRMRMSRREIKREHRDREGDPRLKQKRRQFHGEFAKAVKALREVRGADVIIVNPVHYAAALRYDRGTMAAPKIVALGAGEMARRIRRVAFTYGVLTITDPPLARALARRGQAGSPIAPELYQPVADLYLRHKIGQRRDAVPAAPIRA